MGQQWANNGPTMGQQWANNGPTMGQQWANNGRGGVCGLKWPAQGFCARGPGPAQKSGHVSSSMGHVGHSMSSLVGQLLPPKQHFN